jgi:hypothetical protein
MYTSYKSVLKLFLILCCAGLSHGAFAQNAALDSLLKGFDQLRLGDPISKFEGQITLIKGVDTTKKDLSPFIYGYSGPRPVPIDSTLVKFRSFYIGFDNDDQLCNISYVAFYGSHPNVFPIRQAKKDLSKLLNYYTEKTGRPGTKVIYYQSKGKVIHEGYEWTNGSAVLKVDHYPSDKKRSSIGVTLDKKS